MATPRACSSRAPSCSSTSPPPASTPLQHHLTAMFAYVFASAIAVPRGGDYRAYLVAGMFAQGTIVP